MTSSRDSDIICPDSLLYKCVAHFMGRKAPGSSIDSIESIQKPLFEIYNVGSSCLAKDIARDVHLLVFTSGIYAIPSNPIDPKIWIPMQNFRSCAAVKGVGASNDSAYGCSLSFKALDSPEASSSPLPAIFTVTSARGNCVPLLDCYIFSCPSDAIAMTLVEKSRQAFGDKKGWSSKPPPLTMSDIIDNFANAKWNCKSDEMILESKEPINPELYQKPSLNGFFYAPKSDVIRTFDIGIEAEAYPLPEVHNEPQQDTFCPQYIIIDQQADANIDQFQPPSSLQMQQYNVQIDPVQSTDSKNVLLEEPIIGNYQIPDLYGFSEQGIMPPPYADVVVSRGTMAPMTTGYPVFDRSNMPVITTYPYAVMPETGYYPAIHRPAA